MIFCYLRKFLIYKFGRSRLIQQIITTITELAHICSTLTYGDTYQMKIGMQVDIYFIVARVLWELVLV